MCLQAIHCNIQEFCCNGLLGVTWSYIALQGHLVSVTVWFLSNLPVTCCKIRVGNPGWKTGSEIRVRNLGEKSWSEKPGQKSGWEIRVRKTGSEIRKSEREIRAEFRVGKTGSKIRVRNPGRKSGNPGQKSGWEIRAEMQVRNPGSENRDPEIRVRNPGRNPGEKPGQKSGWEIRVGNPEIRNPGVGKTGSKIRVRNPGEMQVGNLGQKSGFGKLVYFIGHFLWNCPFKIRILASKGQG
jgi:hypothetical protein